MGPQQVSEVTEAKVSALQAEGEVASKHFFLRNAAGGCCMQDIAHLESLQQWPVSFTELPQDACFAEPIVGEAQPLQQRPLCIR